MTGARTLVALVAFTSFSVGTASSTLPTLTVAQYWPAYKATVQSPSQIPWTSLSLAYYFVIPTTPTGILIDSSQETEDIFAFVQQAHQNDKKALFSVGGWAGSAFFSQLVATSVTRALFVGVLLEFAVKYGFDGVDIDWEYPGVAGCKTEASYRESEGFLALLHSLREALGESRLITAAVPTCGWVAAGGSSVANLAAFGNVLDFVNLMTYDIGASTATTGPNAPLRSCNTPSSVEEAVALLTKSGFPASKILIGVPSYGHSFTTASSTLEVTSVRGLKSLMFQPVSAIIPKGDRTDAASFAPGGEVGGQFTGVWQYHNLISEGILSADGKQGLNGYTRYFDQCTQTPFLFNPATRNFIAYSDDQSISAKVKFAEQQGLAGIMIFDSAGFTTEVLQSLRKRITIA